MSPIPTEPVQRVLDRVDGTRPRGKGWEGKCPAHDDNRRSRTIVGIASKWLRRAEQLAGLTPLPGGAFHPLRRKWATERKHLSLKDVAAVSGWTDTQTLTKCYQAADEETMEAVGLQPRRLRMLGA